MEMWARYAHKALWHDYEPGWALHKSHHVPRVGPFEVSPSYILLFCRLCVIRVVALMGASGSATANTSVLTIMLLTEGEARP